MTKTAPPAGAGLEAFAPPDEVAVERGSSLPIAMFWAMGGTALGAAVGAWLQIFGQLHTLVGPAFGGGISFFFLGLISHRAERHWAMSRKQMLDGRGRLVRPMAAWLMMLPMTLGALGFLGLVVVAALRSGSTSPLLVFVIAAIGFIGVSRPVLGGRSLRRAVEALDAGRVGEAKRRLMQIEAAVWWTRSVRSMAALNLGLMSVSAGDFEEAGQWYARAAEGKARALAWTGLSLVRALQLRFGEAEDLLHRASATGEGRHAQAEIDGVRLLIVLRRDGAEDARQLGERIWGTAPGGLFLALLATARHNAGDVEGARELVLSEPAARETLDGAFGTVIPELHALREILDSVD